MDDLTDTLGMLSRALKTLMTIIEGYADMLLEKKKGLSADERDMLGQIKRCSVKTTRLVQNFLTLMEIESGKTNISPRPVPLGLLVPVIANEFSSAAGYKRVSIHSDIPPGLPDAHVDEYHFGRAMSNVLSNAVKFSSEGGRIWVRAGMAAPDLPSRLFLEIKDEGPGIPAKNLPHIFEKYYSADQNGDMAGAGLGLAIVKALTGLHGGSVELSSLEGEGVTVRLVVPASPTAPSIP